MNSYKHMNSYMKNEFIVYMNFYMNLGVPRFQMPIM